jgi:hypothetical protein
LLVIIVVLDILLAMHDFLDGLANAGLESSNAYSFAVGWQLVLLTL